MSSKENAVFLSPYCTQIRKEAIGAGVIQPAFLLDRATTTVVPAAKTEGAYKQILVADLGTINAGALQTPYASGDVVNFKAPQRGELVRLFVGISTTIALNAELASKGAGAVGVPAAAGVGVIAIARTAITTNGSTTGYVTAEIL